MMNVLTIIKVFVIAFCVFMCFRIRWAYKIRKNNTDMVGELVEKKTKNCFYDAKLYQILLNFNGYVNCIWSYDKIVLHFWIWDLRKMVTGREKFDEVHATDDLEAVRKRVIPNTHVANLADGTEE